MWDFLLRCILEWVENIRLPIDADQAKVSTV